MVSARGCGFREENTLYVCVTASEYGQPLEWFLTDPVTPWVGGQIRAPMLIQDPKTMLYHLFLGIGVSYYPFVSDFVEEARIMGISKKIPTNFDTSKLTPGRSGLVLIHPRAIPEFPYVLPAGSVCPKEKYNAELHSDNSLCIGDLWDLSSLKDYELVHSVEKRITDFKIITPSCGYYVNQAIPESDKNFMDYSAGSILFFPKIHFEYVNSKCVAPEELAKPIISQGWPFKVVEA